MLPAGSSLIVEIPSSSEFSSASIVSSSPDGGVSSRRSAACCSMFGISVVDRKSAIWALFGALAPNWSRAAFWMAASPLAQIASA